MIEADEARIGKLEDFPVKMVVAEGVGTKNAQPSGAFPTFRQITVMPWTKPFTPWCLRQLETLAMVSLGALQLVT